MKIGEILRTVVQNPRPVFGVLLLGTMLCYGYVHLSHTGYTVTAEPIDETIGHNQQDIHLKSYSQLSPHSQDLVTQAVDPTSLTLSRDELASSDLDTTYRETLIVEYHGDLYEIQTQHVFTGSDVLGALALLLGRIGSAVLAIALLLYFAVSPFLEPTTPKRTAERST